MMPIGLVVLNSLGPTSGHTKTVTISSLFRIQPKQLVLKIVLQLKKYYITDDLIQTIFFYPPPAVR